MITKRCKGCGLAHIGSVELEKCLVCDDSLRKVVNCETYRQKREREIIETAKRFRNAKI